MIKAEVVDNSTTASDNKDEKTNNETVVVEPLTNSHNNTNVQMPDIIPTSIELDSIQINNKTINKQNKVLFDLDKKQQDDNNNIRRNSNASNVSSKRAITTYNNNNKKTSLDCHRKSTQVEINMDSIVVAKSATNSNNNRNPINNRLRNIIEILRNTFNTSNPSSSSNQTKKNNKSKQKSIQASNNQKQITAPTNTNNEIKSINNNNNNTNKTKETKLNNMTDDDLSVCQLCFNICCMKNKEDGTNYMYDLDTCDHSFCIDCLRLYLKYQIIESRVSISCPQCSEKMHPNDIYRLLSLTNLITTIDNIPTDSLNYLNTITGMKATTTLNNNTPSPLTTSSSSASSTSSSSEIQSTNKKLLPNSIDTGKFFNLSIFSKKREIFLF